MARTIKGRTRGAKPTARESVVEETARRVKRVDPVKVLQVHYVTDGPHVGWAHTHGMAAFGKPELEILAVPSYFAEAAVDVLNSVADYILNEKVVRAGETMQLGRVSRVRFVEAVPLEGDAEHYQVPVLRLVSLVVPECDVCAEGKAVH